MPRIKRRAKYFLAVIASFIFTICTLSFGVYLGFDFSKQLEREYSSHSRFVKKVKSGYGIAFLQERPHRKVITSNRLNLALTEYFVPLEFNNGAGGITEDTAGGVLIVDLAGAIFRFWKDRIVRLDIQTPNSNIDALKRQLETGELGNTDVNFGHFRYNDILLHPVDDQTFLLVSYSEWNTEKRCFTSTLAKVPVPLGDPFDWRIEEADWSIVTRTRPCLTPYETGFGIKGAEAGGRMISRSGSEILWTSGVYNRDDNFDKLRPETALAQSDQTDYGKVLLVDIDLHSVKHIAKGLRNPQGIDIDALGNPLVTDHGMRGGDELNKVHDGANFGFPFVTLGTKYSKKPGGIRSFHTGHDGYDKPLIAFIPAIAPSSVVFLKDFHTDWDGDILIGGLKRKLHRVYIEDGKILLAEQIDIGLKIRDMARLSNGRIAIYTDDNKLVFMEPEAASVQYDRILTRLAAEPDLDLRSATLDAFEGCLKCHGLAKNETGLGPTLYHVCGRKPDTEAFAEYSGALSATIDIWDQNSLIRFISDPVATAPGTSMAWNGISKLDVAELLVRTLCQLD